MLNIDNLIATAPLRLISGEGIEGTIEPYTGTRTQRAIDMRCKRERCNGDRWARVEARIETDIGYVWVTVSSHTRACNGSIGF